MFLVESVGIYRHKFKYLKLSKYKYLILLKYIIVYNIYLKYFYKIINNHIIFIFEFNLRWLDLFMKSSQDLSCKNVNLDVYL